MLQVVRPKAPGRSWVSQGAEILLRVDGLQEDQYVNRAVGRERRYLVTARGYTRTVRRMGHLESRMRGHPWWLRHAATEDVLTDELVDALEEWAYVTALDYEDWLADGAYGEFEPPYPEPGIEAARGRGDSGMSLKSRMEMRRAFGELPWEMLGSRPVMITLTYPWNWRRWVQDGRALERHRRAFKEQWFRKWDERPVGVWGKEFQERGAAHLHWYVGLPAAVSEVDYQGLQERTILRARLEAKHGKRNGRREIPPIGRQYGGEFGWWLLNAWSEIVGTNVETVGYRERAHRWRGADVAAMWWTAEEAAKGGLDVRTNVGEYLAREGSKWGQKRPPLGFTGVGRYWGIVGPPGFKREKNVDDGAFADEAVWKEFLRRQARWVAWKRLRSWPGPPPRSRYERRLRDGMTAFGLTKEQADRMLKWSVAAAERKRLRRTGSAGPEAQPIYGATVSRSGRFCA